MMDLKKNQVIWDGKKEGFYEAYFVQVNDPVSGMAWWFRYSILVPKKGRGLPYAATWAVQYDMSGARGPIAMKHICPLSHYKVEKDRFILYIEDGFLTNSHSTGKIKHGDRSLQWDVQWVPISENFIHFPESWYSSPFPRSKLVSPHWATTGNGFIRWNDGEFYLKDALIHVGHVWGTSHSKRWVWTRSHGFEEDPRMVFEAIFVPLFGPFGLAKCWLNVDGKIERFTKAGCDWHLKSFQNEHLWPFEFSGNGHHVSGKVTVDPSQVAGITYHDPDGSRRYCYNSKVATINLTLKKDGESTHLTAQNTAAFEVCLPKQLDQFKVLI